MNIKLLEQDCVIKNLQKFGFEHQKCNTGDPSMLHFMYGVRAINIQIYEGKCKFNKTLDKCLDNICKQCSISYQEVLNDLKKCA